MYPRADALHAILLVSRLSHFVCSGGLHATVPWLGKSLGFAKCSKLLQIFPAVPKNPSLNMVLFIQMLRISETS